MAFDCFNLGSLVLTDPSLLKNDFFDNLPTSGDGLVMAFV